MWQTAEGNETLIPENRSRLLSDLFDTVGTKQSTSIVDSAQLSPLPQFTALAVFIGFPIQYR